MGRLTAFLIFLVCTWGMPASAHAFTGRQLGHGLLEASVGGALGVGEGGEGTGGASVSLLAGIGGKLRGFPPRFFLVGGVESADWGADQTDRFGAGVVERRAMSWTTGVRVLFPLWSRTWRLVTEARTGVAFVQSDGGRVGLPSVATDDTFGIMLLGAGLQARLADRLSAGLRLDRTWGLDGGADMAAAAAGLGDDGSGRGRLALGLTFTLHL
jgi:hypothetical protein